MTSLGSLLMILGIFLLVEGWTTPGIQFLEALLGGGLFTAGNSISHWKPS